MLCIFGGSSFGYSQAKFYTAVSEGPLVAGQPFQVQYVTEGAAEIKDFNYPAFKDFSVLDVFDSKSTSIQSPNYQVVETFSKIVVLASKKAGNFTIPGATATIDGKKLVSNSIKVKIITVSAASTLMNHPDEIPVDELSVLKTGEDIEKKIKQNHFVKAASTKTTCFAGEELMLTYKLYSRLNASSQVQKRPPLTGFSVMEMVDRYDARPDNEKINGLTFSSSLVRQVHAFPLQPGHYKIGAAEISSTIHFVKGDASGIGNSFYDHPVIISSNELEIDVNPLPANQPENFSGAVGRFNMGIEVLQKEIHPGDLVKIKVTIRGVGNIPLLVPPEIKWPNGVDTADPVVKEEFNKYIFPLEGSKTFEYSFAAPDSGDYIIPATVFAYFNPATKSYEQSKSDSITLHVTPELNRAEVLRPNADAAKANEPRQLYWFAIIAVLILAWIGYQVSQWNKPDKSKKPASIQNVIVEEKRDPLLNARIALSNENILAFYKETEQAVWQVVGDTCKVLPSSLNKQNITTVLANKGFNHDVISELMAVLKECEWALYAPDHETADAENLLNRVAPLLEKISA